MKEDFTKEVAKALVAKTEKSVLISIIENILDNEENYDNYIAQYVISKCIGKPQITIVDVDLEKINKYAKEHFTNKYTTLVEDSVKLLGVNPVKRTVKISYEYFNNDDDEKNESSSTYADAHSSTYEIDTQYYDILK